MTLVRIVDRLVISRTGPDAPQEMPPITLDWYLVITLKSGDARGTHPVEVTPHLPSGESLQQIVLPAHLEGINKGVNLISQMNMQLTMSGIYWFHISVENELITKVPVEVIYARAVTPSQQ